MAKYYKGILGYHNEVLKSSEFTLGGYRETYNEVVVYNLHNNAFHNSKYEEDKLSEYLLPIKRKNYKVTNQEIIDILDDLFNYSNTNLDLKRETQIIFEIVKDNDGNLYAKELVSGLIFPILIQSKNIKGFYNVSLDKEDDYVLKYEIKLYNSKMKKLESCLTNRTITEVNTDEVQEYLNKYNGLNEKIYLLRLKSLFEKNIIDESFQTIPYDKLEDAPIVASYQEPKKLKKPSYESTLIANIKLLLKQIRVFNPNLYEEKLEKFNNLRSNAGLSLNSMSRISLEQLKIDLEMVIIFEKNDPSYILNYIKKMKESYDNYIYNQGEKVDITLEYLDIVTENFLMQKNKYDLNSENEILDNLAYLYLYEVYENKDNLDIYKLENSYFKSVYLERIITCLYDLQYEGKIEDNILMNLNLEYDTKKVLDLIKEIKFKDKEKVKTFIKN